jgi:hypothetical protein
MDERVFEGLNGGGRSEPQTFKFSISRLSVGRRTLDVAFEDDFAAFDSSGWTEVDEVGGGFDGVFIVLDENERVAFFLESMESFQKSGVVAWVESDGRFVENVENALKVRAELGGQANTLGLAAGEGGGGAIELEVAEADVIEEFETLDDFGDDVAGDEMVASFEFENLNEDEAVFYGEG